MTIRPTLVDFGGAVEGVTGFRRPNGEMTRLYTGRTGGGSERWTCYGLEWNLQQQHNLAAIATTITLINNKKLQ